MSLDVQYTWGNGEDFFLAQDRNRKSVSRSKFYIASANLVSLGIWEWLQIRHLYTWLFGDAQETVSVIACTAVTQKSMRKTRN